MSTTSLTQRLEERIRDWNVIVQETIETPSSVLAFGTRYNQPVVLKVLRHPGDEWRSGEVLNTFDSRGVVRVYEYTEGALLLERLIPGTSLAGMALDGRDSKATEIIAEVIQRMSPSSSSLKGIVTVEDWGNGFQRYLTSGDTQIERTLVVTAQQFYAELCTSQSARKLLHGDLQHYNILFDRERGWIAIDPKGVIGEIEYEIGASLRNPYENPELFTNRAVIEARLKTFVAKLNLDEHRALAWGFAQAVLSAIWEIEDGSRINDKNASLMLADTIRPLLDNRL